MNRTVIALAAMAFVMLGASAAKAQQHDVYGNAGIYGEPVQFDQSTDMRRSTIEQFDPTRGQSVASRPRPDFDAAPISIGSFNLFPTLNAGGYYDSNIFAQDTHELSDWVWKLNPTIALNSNWGKDALSVNAYGDFDYYSVHKAQNYDDGAVQVDGRWDIAHQTWLAGAVGYQRVTELRGNPNTPGAQSGPSQYHLLTGNGDLYRGLGQLKGSVGYSVSYYDYDPLELIGGGHSGQTGRNRIQNDAHTKVSYDLTENLKPFVRGSYNFRHYTSNSLHSSNGYQVDTGADVDLGGIITAEAYGGYMNQNYFNFASGDVGTWDLGGSVLWNVTELTSVEFRGSRSIEETTGTGSQALVDSSGTVTVTHELRRDVLLEGHISYSGLDFQNSKSHDDVYDAGFGGRYFVSRNLYGDMTYDFERFGANTAGPNNYSRSILLARVGVQY